jgi:hypothetical protein
MNAEKLNEILRLHLMWINDEPGGRQATLSGADLRGTDLRGVNLSLADLNGADLRGAKLCDTKLFNVSLRNAKLPQGCKYYWDLPKHDITIIHDVAHIGCRSMPLSEWFELGPEIGEDYGYTPEQIDLYMEILRKEHERERTK